MNRKTFVLILKDLRNSGSWSQCERKSERGLSMNREVVARASRPCVGRTNRTGETPVPLFRRSIVWFMDAMHSRTRNGAFHEPQGAAGILRAVEPKKSSADETSAAPCWQVHGPDARSKGCEYSP